MSRYRYLRRTSSLTLTSPSTGNGSGSASDSTSTTSAATSIAPVGISAFSFPAGRARTLPVTRTQDSGRSVDSEAPRHTTCTVPLASRRSMNATPPWSRRRATQPASVTSSPAFAARSVPASCVLIIFPAFPVATP